MSVWFQSHRGDCFHRQLEVKLQEEPSKTEGWLQARYQDPPRVHPPPRTPTLSQLCWLHLPTPRSGLWLYIQTGKRAHPRCLGKSRGHLMAFPEIPTQFSTWAQLATGIWSQQQNYYSCMSLFCLVPSYLWVLRKEEPHMLMKAVVSPILRDVGGRGLWGSTRSQEWSVPTMSPESTWEPSHPLAPPHWLVQPSFPDSLMQADTLTQIKNIPHLETLWFSSLEESLFSNLLWWETWLLFFIIVRLKF